MKTSTWLAAAAAGAAVGIPAAAHASWVRRSRQIERAIISDSAPVDGEVSLDSYAGQVPEPVERFFRRTLRDGQRMIRVARLRQEGEFLLNGSWRAMRARQVFSATPAAFVWDARIAMAPMLNVYVRDSYRERGSMLASMLALYPVVDQSGSAELNAGALMRYLGEAAWLPTRLLPGHGMAWTAIDEQSAEATLVDRDVSVSLIFSFSACGHIREIYSPGRFREVSGAYVLTPWRIRALGHDVHDGMPLMSPAVAEWVLPEGPLEYWRGRIASIDYEY